jgi:hypothetical protein
VPGKSPVKLAVKLPVPDPETTTEFNKVGEGDVLKHKPRADTEDPPEFVTVPPPILLVPELVPEKVNTESVVTSGGQPPHVGTPLHIFKP